MENGKQYSKLKFKSSFSLKESCEFIANLNELPNPTRPPRNIGSFAIYGAGKLGKMAIEFLNYFGLKPDCIVDKKPKGVFKDSFWNNYELIKLSECSDELKSVPLILCIVTDSICDVINDLIEEGWQNIIPFYDFANAFAGQHPLNNGWFADKLTSNDLLSINKVLEDFSDEISRSHFIQFFAWRRSRIEVEFLDCPINVNDRFFIPEVISKLGKREVFLDCGSHTGTVIEKFISQVNGDYGEIIAIEPDAKNSKLLLEFVNEKKIHNFTYLPYVLGDSEEYVSFSEGFDYASRATLFGEKKIESKTLDSLNLRPTFIKLHLEGHELKVLKGAIDTIKKYRPIIASTIYHNDDGFFKTPIYLMSNLENYHFYLRQHNWAGTGVVLYAIPIYR